jgi:hypothetical protein
MASPRFDTAIFTDDFLRSDANGLHCHDANRKFLRGLFDTSLQRLGLAAHDAAARTSGGAIDVARLMARLELPCSPEGWAAACTADLGGLRGQHGLPAFGPGCLVIGWGMPPSLQRCIDDSGASYLDVEIHPVRFTTHLHLCARTNDPVIETMLRAHRVDEEAFWNHAAAMKAYFARRGEGTLFDPGLRVGLFFGQTLVDLALVSDGRTVSPENVIEPLRQLAQGVDLLVVKPHPYEPVMRHLAPIARAIPNLAWTRENTYALLAASNTDVVCALSSGVLTEARYFMKQTHALIRPDRNAAASLPARCSEWIPVGADIASMHCMAIVCGAAHAPPAVEWPAAAIEFAFASRWDFDAHSLGLGTLPPAELERTHGFGAASPASAWLSHGWARPGRWSVRTEGELACIVIPLPHDADAQLFELRIEGSCPLGAAASPGIRAVANGVAVAARPRRYAGFDAIEFVLQAVAHGAPGRRALVVQFEIGDPRRASLVLKRLKVSLPKPAPGASATRGAAAPEGAGTASRTGAMLRAWLHWPRGDHPVR